MTRPRAVCAHILVVLAVTAGAGCDPASSQGATAGKKEVPDEITCRSCSISYRTISTLGTLEGPGALEYQPLSFNVDKRGNYYVWARRLPQVFGRDGKIIRRFGQLGPGPREFQGRLEPVPIPGDSILILQANQATIFTPDYQYARTIRLPGFFNQPVIIRWPDSVFAAGIVPTRSRHGFPLHLLSFRTNEAEIIASGGSTGPGEFEREWIGVVRSGGSPWWTIDRLYTLKQFDARLRPVAVLERKPSWWTYDPGQLAGLPHIKPPSHFVEAASMDSQGLIWVFIAAPSKRWRDAWVNVPRGATEIPGHLVDRDALWDTMVEVLDPDRALVLVRQVFEGIHVIAALPDNRAVTFTERNGYPEAEVIELVLER